MIVIFGVFLLTMLVITSVAIVRTRNLFVAVMLTSIFSLLMAANFFILDAADVALTEAAVGAGITTVIFLGALALTAERETSQVSRSRWLVLAIVSITIGLLFYATFDTPRLGDGTAPVHNHIVPWYFTTTASDIEIPNVVTSVLSSFRGYDTLGEVFVVFTACIGVLFVLSASRPACSERKKRANTDLRHHLIPRVVGRLVIPFIILFGLYVQFHGEYGPGGGFQAGAIIAAAFVLHALLEGEAAALKVISRGVLLGMAAGGAILYTAVGIACLSLGGNFLDYSVLHSDPVVGQQMGIIIIELGVGVTVCGALLAIFHAFAARDEY